MLMIYLTCSLKYVPKQSKGWTLREPSVKEESNNLTQPVFYFCRGLSKPPEGARTRPIEMVTR